MGRLAEAAAEEFLKRKDYKILEKNFWKRAVSGPWQGEIDIIAEKDKEVVFVEVKSGKKSPGFFPEDRVNFRKKNKIIKAAELWLLKNKKLENKWRIDVISAVLDENGEKFKIRHFENAVF